jgi:hypothetical protein
MAVRDPEYYERDLDPEAWPEFMRAGLMPVPPSGQAISAFPRGTRPDFVGVCAGRSAEI